MNKEVVKVIPECVEKIGKITPAKLREIRKIIDHILPFSVLMGTIYYIHKERMTDKKYEHEEMKLQMEHDERMLEIKAKLSNREEESDINEKDN